MDDSNDNNLSGNIIIYNDHDVKGDGINFYNSDNNIVYGNVIGKSGDSGIELTNSTGNNILDNRIFDNNQIGVLIKGVTSDNRLHYNRIYGNFRYGVYNLNDSVILNATLNYWGSVTGPYHPVNNSDGRGDNVSDGVSFKPWIGEGGGVIEEGDIQSNVTTVGYEMIDALGNAGVIVGVNSSSPTNVTIVNYSSAPDDFPCDLKAVGRYIDIEVENESAIVWPINITLYYTREDLNNSGLEENQLVGIYYWNGSGWKLYNDTGVNTTDITIGSICYEGYLWARVWHLTPMSGGADVEPPSKVTGLSVRDAKNGKLDLSWDAACDNTGVAYYKVYRDGVLIANVTSTSYRDTGLINGQTYTYRVSAVDSMVMRVIYLILLVVNPLLLLLVVAPAVLLLHQVIILLLLLLVDHTKVLLVRL